MCPSTAISRRSPAIHAGGLERRRHRLRVRVVRVVDDADPVGRRERLHPPRATRPRVPRAGGRAPPAGRRAPARPRPPRARWTPCAPPATASVDRRAIARRTSGTTAQPSASERHVLRAHVRVGRRGRRSRPGPAPRRVARRRRGRRAFRTATPPPRGLHRLGRRLHDGLPGPEDLHVRHADVRDHHDRRAARSRTAASRRPCDALRAPRSTTSRPAGRAEDGHRQPDLVVERARARVGAARGAERPPPPCPSSTSCRSRR